MIKIVSIIDSIHIHNSSLNKFVAECDDGSLWVILLKKQNDFRSSRRLFSEYIASILAKEFGINTHDVSLVKIEFEDHILNSISEDSFDKYCNVGVATKFIESENFKELYKRYKLSLNTKSTPFEIANEILRDSSNFNQLYGMKVFLHWIYLDDYHKCDTLLVDKQKKIFFCDFNMAFRNYHFPFLDGNQSDIWSNLSDYSCENINFTRNHYCFDELITDLNNYEEWFQRLRSINENVINSIIGILPQCWDIPNNYQSDTINFIFSNRDKYIDEFKIALKKYLVTK